jgi:glycosyltransferase involved in cell wall biosynthesis
MWYKGVGEERSVMVFENKIQWLKKSKPSVRGVVLVSPGGIMRGGGIGSVTRSIKTWVDAYHPDVRIDVLDARGESNVYWSLLFLQVAIIRLIYIRIRHRSEILHLQVSENLSFPRKGVLLALGRFIGMRIVLHHHGAEFIPFFNKSSPRMRTLVRWMIRSADVNIVLGELWEKFLVQEVGVDSDRVVIRFNAAQDVQTTGQRTVSDPWRFLIVANLSPRKGVAELLQAVAQLAQAGSPVELTLAGGGEIERYREMTIALGIADRCVFTGWIAGEDIQKLLLSHSALVLPSYQEGLPMSIIEALSARLPVVTTPVGSIPDLLDNEITCLFVEPGNVHQIAQALSRISSEPALRQTLTDNGRRLYERYFEVTSYMEGMLALYGGIKAGAKVHG